jgi:preprotein translocase subunit YajC
MRGLLDAIPLIFAQAGAAARPADGNNMWSLLPYLAIPVLFYFMFIRPNMQQERKRKQMLEALKKNDRVLTSAGIYGTVMSIDPEGDRVVLRIDDDRGVKVAFSRASVVRVVEASADKEKDKAAEAVQPGAAPK